MPVNAKDMPAGGNSSQPEGKPRDDESVILIASFF
jgi:hypothetical protein